MRYPLLFTLIASVVLAHAQSFIQIEKVLASDRSIFDQFGKSVAISGDFAMVGAPLEDLVNDPLVPNRGNGAVYVYQKSEDGTWSEVQKLTASDRADEENQFGLSVSMDGDYAVIGAYFDDYGTDGGVWTLNAGAAYIFKKDPSGIWNEVAILEADVRVISGVFGNQVSISGTTVAISSTGEGHSEMDSNFYARAGAVFVFEKALDDTWNQVQKITASDRQAYDHFGTSVAIHGSQIIVGAPGQDYDLEGENYLLLAGAGYIFEKDASGVWVEIQKLVPDDRVFTDYLGQSVSINNDFAIISSTGQDYDKLGDNEEINAGAIYVYKKTSPANWEFHSKLVASDRLQAGAFGYNTALNDTRMAITSARSAFSTESNSGVVYLFQRDATDNWVEIQRVAPTDIITEDISGKGVALEGSTIIMGAPGADYNTSGEDSLSNSGAAYFFNDGTSTGIETSNQFADFTVFPNPAINIIYVDLGQSYSELTASLISVDGKVIRIESFEHTSQFAFELNKTPGTYFLEVKAASGQYSVRKVISKGF